MTTYGCVARWASGSDEWKSGTLEVLATWLAGGDFTEAVIQPIPSATLDMLRYPDGKPYRRKLHPELRGMLTEVGYRAMFGIIAENYPQREHRVARIRQRATQTWCPVRH